MILRTIFKHYFSSTLKYIPFYNSTYPSSIYLFEVNNENIGTTCEICSNLTIKTLNIFHNLLYCFYTWLWTSKYQPVKVKCEYWSRHASKICLNTLKFFTENCKTYRNLAKPTSVSKLTPVRFYSSVKFINNIFGNFNNMYYFFIVWSRHWKSPWKIIE